MPAPTPDRWADPFRLEPPAAARLAQALAATPAARSGPRWDSCPTPAPIRQQLRRMVAAQLLADRARRRALGLLQLAAMAAKVPGIGSDGIAAGGGLGAGFDALPQLAAEAEGSEGAEDWQWAGGSGGGSRIGRNRTGSRG